MKVQSPLKYHGGKTYLAPRIVALMPAHVHYVEPYCGGCSVLFASGEKFPDRSEVVNDIDRELCRFWWALQDPDTRTMFLERCRFTPFGRAEFGGAKDVLEGVAKAKTKEQEAAVVAWAFFVRNRQSLAGRGKDFAPLTKFRTRRGVNEQASAWIGAVDLLGEMVDRLRSVVVECDDAVNVIRREDTPGTLFYLDPPYLEETVSAPDVYAHRMTDQQHEALLDVVTAKTFAGKVMLSGYASKLYSRRLKGWRVERIKIDNKSAGGAVKDVCVEHLWMNYK